MNSLTSEPSASSRATLTSVPAPEASPDQFLEIRGRRIRVRVRAGEEGGIPLLICNGIGASLDVLDPFVEALDPSLTVVRFDVPGTGESPTPTLPYTIAQMAWLATSVMTRLGYAGRFDVLGYSWGGSVAQHLAATHPRRVRRLVLLATGTGVMMVPGSPNVLGRMISPRRFTDPAYAMALAPRIYGGTARDHRGAIGRVFRTLERGGSRRGYAYQLLAGGMWTSLPFLSAIRQQTLVLCGDDDPIIPLVNGRILAKGIAHARLHVYSGGHVEAVIEPPRIAAPISEFLVQPENA